MADTLRGPVRIPAVTPDVISRAPFFPTRARGQNFLHDRSVAARFAMEALRPITGGTAAPAIVEIGPGKGAITMPLLEQGVRVLAIEIDARLADLLTSRVRERGLEENFGLVRGDALRLDLAAAVREFGAAPPLPLCGNLPFSTASLLLLRLLEGGGSARPPLVAPLTLTLQREVAERAAAPPNTPAYGALSVVVQQAMRAEIRFLIHPGAFRPRPRVVAAVVRFEPRTDPPEVGDEGHFRRLVRGLFLHRRKTLRNAAAGLPGVSEDFPGRVLAALESLGVSLERRAESLPPETFAEISRRTAQPEDSRGRGRSGRAPEAEAGC